MNQFHNSGRAAALLSSLLALSPCIASADLVGHWPLDADASDATGNGHNGAVVGGTVNFGQPGANASTGAAAAFPNNGHIDVPYSPALNPGAQGPNGSGSFTVALWANASAAGGGTFRSPFTSREDFGGAVNGPIIYNNNAGNWSYWAGNNGPPGAWNALNDGPVAINTWTHVAITYDAAGPTRKMFLDGVEVLSANLGVSANVLRDLHIGSGQDNGANFYWDGLIDDVGLWDEPLSPADIQFVMANGVGKHIFTGPGADWSNDANWALVEPVASGDACIGGGFTAFITAAGEVANSVSVAHNQPTDPGAGTLNVTNGDLTVTDDLTLGDLTFLGNVNQSFGTVSVGGDLVFGPTGGAGDRGGTYNLNGGTLTVTGDVIETIEQINSAQFQLNNGTLNVGGNITTQRLALAQAGGGNFTYNIPAGQIVTTTGTTAVGVNGTGNLTLSAAGSALNSVNAFVGETGTGNGTVTIDGGRTWTVDQFLRIGNSGTGLVDLKSGTIDILGTSGNPRGLRLAENNSGDGTLIIGVPGGSGTADPTVNVSGGNTEGADNGMGRITMHSGTFNQITNNLIIGQNSVSDGEFVLEDGLIDIQDQLRIANRGRGVFTMNGGTVNVGTILDLANNAGADSDATLNVNGGILNIGDRVNSDMKIGNENRATSTSVVNIIDGTVNITRNIRIADNGANSSGTLIVGDGTSAPIINLNTAAGNNFESADNGTGVFTFNSGTITQNNSNFIAGQTNTSSATVRIGGGTIPAIFNLNGGDGNRDWNTNQGAADITILDNADINIGRNVNLTNNAAGSCLLKLEGGSFDVSNNFAYRNNGDDEVVVSGGELLIGNNLNINNPSSDASDGNIFSVVGDGATQISVGNTFNGGAQGTLKFAPSATGLTPIDVGNAVNTNGMDIAFDLSALTSATTLGDIVLIDNNAAPAINGLFGGLTENTVVHTFGDNTQYKISYIYNAATNTRGTGNDLALLSNEPPTLAIPDQMILTSSPALNLPLFPLVNDPDNGDTALTYTVTMNTNMLLVSTDPISSGDGILTLTTPCTLKGTADITIEVQDPCGLKVSDTFTVTVKDDVAPEVITPGLVKVLAPAGQSSAVVTFTVTGLDKVDGTNVTIVCTPPSGSVFNWGATTVNCTATDQSGNVSTTGSFIVSVKLPDDVMLESVSVGDAADGASGVGDGTYNRIDGAHLTANGKLLVAAEVDLNKGLWSGGITGLSLVGMGPITLPPGGGGEALLAFDRYAVGENGDSGFRARLDGGGEGHWASSAGVLSEVAVVGGAVPGVPGTSFFKLPEKGWAVTNSGEYFYLGQMDKADAGINEANNQGIFSSVGGLLIREGSLASEIGGGATYTNFENQISANDAGQVAFASALRLGTVVSGGDNRAVFCGDPSSPSVVARRGDAAPGAGGAEFDSFLDVGLNAAGECVLFSRLRGAVTPDDDTGLWSDGGGTLALVAREGAEAPGFGAATTVYDSFSDAQITDGGAVVFRAEVRDTAVPLSANENEAIYVWTPGVGVALVAREGGDAPETSGVYTSLPELSVHRGGELGFNGVLRRGVGGVTRRTQHGVWVHDLANAGADPILLVQAGDPITVGGEEETVTRPSITGGKDGGTAGRSSAVACGNVAVVVSYDQNRATTVFVMGVPDPAP